MTARIEALPARSEYALKEWAAIEQLLGAGELTLLLRKGGLWERRDGFEMEHRRFWLFPTLYHQNDTELRPELSWALAAAEEAHPEPEQIRLEHFAEVTDAFRVEDLPTLLSLVDAQGLTRETIESRFHYRNRPYLHALLLRVYRLPCPHLISNTMDYEGCVSWVTLDDALATEGALPVLTDEQFSTRRMELLRRLADTPGVEQV